MNPSETVIEDRNLQSITALPTPEQVKTGLPLSAQAARMVRETRDAVRSLLHGKDHRLLALVGPCSLHDPEAALEYAERLAPVARELSGELLVMMRAYFEKPRTTVGWKGLVNDPHLDGSCRVAEGLAAARTLLLQIGERGVPCATEFLDPVSPQYLADGVCWAAIGARTTESQTHRELASGLSMPVGFKNGTDGNWQVAVDAMVAAKHPHSFLGIRTGGEVAVVKTLGNADTHLVLRGGRGGTNYDRATTQAAAAGAAQAGAARGVLIDCSHGNSEKDHRRQGVVLREVARQVQGGAQGILGVMLESHLQAGNQPWEAGAALRYGVSITDACIDFEETKRLLSELARAGRRARGGKARAGLRRSAAA